MTHTKLFLVTQKYSEQVRYLRLWCSSATCALLALGSAATPWRAKFGGLAWRRSLKVDGLLQHLAISTWRCNVLLHTVDDPLRPRDRLEFRINGGGSGCDASAATLILTPRYELMRLNCGSSTDPLLRKFRVGSFITPTVSAKTLLLQFVDEVVIHLRAKDV